MPAIEKVIYVFKTHFKFLFCIEESAVEKTSKYLALKFTVFARRFS